jgi:hypothetical protein
MGLRGSGDLLLRAGDTHQPIAAPIRANSTAKAGIFEVSEELDAMV